MRSRETGIKEIGNAGTITGYRLFLQKDDSLSINASKGNVTLWRIPNDAWENVDGIFRADIYTTSQMECISGLYRKCVFRVLEVNGELKTVHVFQKGFYKHLYVWDHQCLSACDRRGTQTYKSQLYSLNITKGSWYLAGYGFCRIAGIS